MVARQVGGEGGWVGDVGVDDETIAVGDEVKKTLHYLLEGLVVRLTSVVGGKGVP